MVIKIPFPVRLHVTVLRAPVAFPARASQKSFKMKISSHLNFTNFFGFVLSPFSLELKPGSWFMVRKPCLGIRRLEILGFLWVNYESIKRALPCLFFAFGPWAFSFSSAVWYGEPPLLSQFESTKIQTTFPMFIISRVLSSTVKVKISLIQHFIKFAHLHSNTTFY